MNIFLEGEIQIGKSTLIYDIFKNKEVTGLLTQRLIENGNIVGFRVEYIKGKYPPLEVTYKGDEKNIFLLKREMNIVVLEENIIKLEKTLKNNKENIIILDEIGGIELKSRVFLNSIKNILQSNRICVGVLKSRENLIRTMKKKGLGNEYLEYNKELKKIIEKNGEIINVNRKNREDVKKYIENLIYNNELKKR